MPVRRRAEDTLATVADLRQFSKVLASRRVLTPEEFKVREEKKHSGKQEELDGSPDELLMIYGTTSTETMRPCIEAGRAEMVWLPNQNLSALDLAGHSRHKNITGEHDTETNRYDVTRMSRRDAMTVCLLPLIDQRCVTGPPNSSSSSRYMSPRTTDATAREHHDR